MNRNNRTARRALVARVESLEGRISLTTVGITKITNFSQYTLAPYTFPSPRRRAAGPRSPSTRARPTPSRAASTIDRPGPGPTLASKPPTIDADRHPDPRPERHAAAPTTPSAPTAGRGNALVTPDSLAYDRGVTRTLPLPPCRLVPIVAAPGSGAASLPVYPSMRGHVPWPITAPFRSSTAPPSS